MDKTKKLLKQLKRKETRHIAVKGKEPFIIPNLSGDLARSRRRGTPTDDYDVANKKYVDDNVGGGGGYWDRTGTTVETATAGDDVETTGRFLVGNGTVGDPAVKFSSDEDTGIYRVDSNQLGFSAGGTKELQIDANGITLKSGSSVNDIKDEDDMASDSATSLATQQSIKKYVDDECDKIEGTAILSTGEGGGSKYLREDGDGTCSWQTPAGGTDVNVAVDAAASAGYLGAANNDGVLRTGTGISYADGGDYVTLTTNDSEIDHDSLNNFVAGEHFLQSDITEVGTIDTGVWNGTAIDGAYIDIEGTEIKSTGEGGGTKFLREDGDGTCSWQSVSGSGDNVTVNATAIDTTANFKDTTSIAWSITDGGAGGPDDVEGTINIVGDTTPQLGGDLDLNGNNIDFPSTANISDCKDEDDMASDSATMLATQQSIKAYVDAKWTSAYPIGSIWISTASTNPNTLLGFGTWAAFGEGKVLVGLDSGDEDFNSSEETGGSKTHTLTTAEMPAHTHTYNEFTVGGSGTDTGTGVSTTSQDTGSTGGGNAHNNLQPYIVVYMFKRTA